MKNDEDPEETTGGFDHPSALNRELDSLRRKLRWAQESQALAVRILTLLNRPIAGGDAIRELLGMVKDFTGFDAVAIRLREGDDFPYFETKGFPADFVEAENSLCVRTDDGAIVRDEAGNSVLECMCGNILLGRTDPSLSFFTRGGSFWSSNTTELLATTSEKERQARTRNRCNSYGYESVALIPLRSEGETIGLLQLNDSRTDRFTPDMIRFFEGIGASIGIVLARKKSEEVLRETKDELERTVQERTADLRKTNERLLSEIGERKKAEATLQSEKDKLTGILDRMNDGVYIVNSRYEITYINPALESAFGPLGNHTCFQYLCGENEPCPPCQMREVLEGGSSSREWHAEKTGKTYERFATPIRNDDGSMSKVEFLHDITHRRLAEVALKMSEERYRAIFDTASIGIDVVDSEGRFLQLNDAFARMLGYAKDELEGLTVFDITLPEDREASRAKLEQIVRENAGSYRFEKRFLRKDREILWGDVSVSVVRDSDGRYLTAIGVISDITERILAEAERQRLASAIEQAAEAVVITDVGGAIQYVNPAFERITGYTREEALGQNPRLLKSGQHDKSFYRLLWDTIKKGNTWSGRLINKRKDGSVYHEEGTISPVKDASGKITNFVAVKRDITQHLELSKQLFQAQKMEAIGTLAGGIAHDFNNLLQVVLGYSELLLGDRTKGDQDYEDLQKIRHAAGSGADLVRSLLTFSRKIEPNPIAVNLNKQLRHVEKLLDRTLPKMIDIRLDLAPDLQRIQADPGQMDQILMNLAVNARDAMGQEGSLTIRTENVTLDEEYCRLHAGAEPGNYVLLSVSDTGHGIDRETLEHIFEPFFTTKELGRGTGLGLAMVYGIVKQHGGHVTCYSEVGLGSTFRVYLPVFSAEEEAVPEPWGEMPAGGTETILLVDDEDLIRQLGERILVKSGYTVLNAVNGKEALETYEREKDRIALVILDLIMPKMGGRDCLENLLRIDPGVKVLVASGYAADAVTRECVELGAKGFVSKPFRFRVLLTQVRSFLDGR